MYAIFESGGKQYKAQAGDRVRVEKLAGEAGARIKIESVIAFSDGDALKTGTPYLDGACVNAEILNTGKGEKIIVFKYKSKKDFRKKQGHRQPYTDLLIENFTIGGKAFGEAPKKAKADKKAEEAKPDEAVAVKPEKKAKAKADKKAEEAKPDETVEVKEEAVEAPAETVAEAPKKAKPNKKAEETKPEEAAAEGAKKETKADIMAKLDELGVTYVKSAKKDELLALLADAEAK